MRSFKDGDIIVVEPWRAAAFPVIKDLAVDKEVLRIEFKLQEDLFL
jgi:succinate dehydrogenase/fumarate reductase-like Fe-S protein